MKKHIRLKNNQIIIIALLVLLTGCGRDEKKTEYVAKVNNSYLTEEDLTAISGKDGGQNLFKQEVIRNWINREVLYQEALKKGITEREEYKFLVRNSGKELAASLMIQEYFAENITDIKPEEVKTFFEDHGDFFKVHQTAYIINTAEFIDEDKAITFRSAAVETDWNKAISFLQNERTLRKVETDRLIYAYDLQPLRLNRMLNELNPGEVSLILPGDGDGYLIVKLISKLNPGTIPPFEVIKENVERRFIAMKKSELLEQYYQELYMENEIDVKQ